MQNKFRDSVEFQLCAPRVWIWLGDVLASGGVFSDTVVQVASETLVLIHGNSGFLDDEHV